ncbi:MAG: arsenate reductase (glutaredoxin) [Legionella sp.]|nr:MAG: arsenate reductase (glutaredoxin) [Legionella sp.]
MEKETAMRVTIYHNPKCSKSRKALELLQDHSIQPIIVEYLKTPLDLEELQTLSTYFELKEFVRHDDPLFKGLKLTLEDKDQVLKAMIKHPIFMQRPIVTSGDQAMIARPPEKVLELINSR